MIQTIGEVMRNNYTPIWDGHNDAQTEKHNDPR